MSLCVNGRCPFRGRLHLVAGVGPEVGLDGYKGGSWCSVACLVEHITNRGGGIIAGAYERPTAKTPVAP